MEREVRTLACDRIEVRRNDDGTVREFVGHAAVFNTLSKPIGGRFVEKIQPGAFRRAISEGQDVRALFNHDANVVLGRTKSGTLTLSEDARGLSIVVTPPDTTAVRDLALSIERGDVDQMSFGFRVTTGGEKWERRSGPGGLDVRTLTDVDLFDVSPVTFAAYEETEVAVRSHDAWSKATDAIGVDAILRALDNDASSFPGDRGELRSHETPRCFLSHLGLYAMVPEYLEAAIAAVSSGSVIVREEARADVDDDGSQLPFELRADGVAVVRIEGSITKRESKFGGASSRGVRRSVEAAVKHPKVRGVMLLIDSPGGQVRGIDEAAAAIALAEKVKPVHAYIEDMGASAAVWLASQAGRITANRLAEYGSVGVFSVVYDMSESFRKRGIRVHVVATGPAKGRGVPGTEISDDDLAQIRSRVESIHVAFVDAVAGGRGLPVEGVAALADGRMFAAREALEHGLIDAVDTFEGAVRALLDVASSGPTDPAGPVVERPVGPSVASLRLRLGLAAL